MRINGFSRNGIRATNQFAINYDSARFLNLLSIKDPDVGKGEDSIR